MQGPSFASDHPGLSRHVSVAGEERTGAVVRKKIGPRQFRLISESFGRLTDNLIGRFI
jgi:hypothetical protein